MAAPTITPADWTTDPELDPFEVRIPEGWLSSTHEDAGTGLSFRFETPYGPRREVATMVTGIAAGDRLEVDAELADVLPTDDERAVEITVDPIVKRVIVELPMNAPALKEEHQEDFSRRVVEALNERRGRSGPYLRVRSGEKVEVAWEQTTDAVRVRVAGFEPELEPEPEGEAAILHPATSVVVRADASEDEVVKSDIAGLQDEWRQIEELAIRPLTEPAAFRGVDPPTAVLLHGPPGTGKTLLARAVAGELDTRLDEDVTTVEVDCSSMFGRYVGQSEENLGERFDSAVSNSPAVLILDEVDSIARAPEGRGQGTERRVVNTLKRRLSESIAPEDDVVVIGTTTDYEAIDDALLRPGRFDRQIQIGVPDRDQRLAIFQYYTREMRLRFGDDELETFADRTVGYTGADIEAVIHEANIAMQRRLRDEIDRWGSIEEVIEEHVRQHDGVYTQGDFEAAIEATEPTLLAKQAIDVGDVGFDDVGGHDDLIQQLQEAARGPLVAPELYDEAPSGILLYGPPGTGKTMLARAVANETNRTFLPVDAPSLRGQLVGETEANIREAFDTARQLGETILFFDEFEAVGRKRGTVTGEGTTDAATQQLLTELDGIGSDDDVLVIGATNVPYEPPAEGGASLRKQSREMDDGIPLDPALLRPGRIGDHFHVGPPDADAQVEIYETYLAALDGDPFVAGSDVTAEWLAQHTPETVTGADIEAVVEGAKGHARRQALEQYGGITDLDRAESDSIDRIEITRGHFETVFAEQWVA